MPTGTATLDRPAHIDPRIRARRIEVQRGKGRRRLQRLADVGLLLTVVVGFGVALRSPLLDVDAVVVLGNEHTPAELVLERAAIGHGDQLADLDLRAAGRRVAELPWVQAVDVHRGLDGRVTLRVTERTAVAVVGESTDAVLVDGEGRALARSADEPDLAASVIRISAGAVRLDPGEYLPQDADGTLALAARLAALPGLAMELSLADGLVGTVPPGIEVRFGDSTQLDAKVRSLRTVLEQVDLACAGVIDVRAPGSPVLTRDERCS